jgi:asparagine synthase (glutamine-hydrolysing)
VIEYGGDYGGAYLLRRGLFMPWELPRLMGKELAKEGWDELQPVARLERSISGIESPRARVSALELQWYMRNQLLRDADWAGMAWSLEIRVPFVDVNLFRTVASLMSSKHPPGKADMAHAPRPTLPPAYLSRKKTGFSIPTTAWIEQSAAAPRDRGLRGWARMLVAD